MRARFASSETSFTRNWLTILIWSKVPSRIAKACLVRFDLIDLSLFRHVVEAGSITHGADRAHLALAAASTRIRQMEEALGAPLLLRGRQGVTPTQAGRTLLQHARSILTQAERLREDLGAYAGGLAGQVRVLSNTNALTEFLPETLSSFLAAHPHVSVDLEERLSDEIVGLIAEGVADIGIVAGTVDAGRLTTYPFRSDRFVLVVARDHPLARRAKISFAEVLDHDFVGLDRASALQRFLADKASRVGRPLRLRVQLRSFDAVCRLVERNVGVGIVPQTTVRWAEQTMAIKAVDLTDPWALRELTICVRDYGALPPYARQLVDHMRASAKDG
jgi:DNA-binding transcriptional LysR family regulator